MAHLNTSRLGLSMIGACGLFTLFACSSRSAPAQTPAPQSVPVPQALDTSSVKTAPATTPHPASAVLDTPAAQAPGDKSALASPVPPERMGLSFRIGTPVSMQITNAVTSGTQRNGDTVHGVLASPLQTSTGATLPRGALVEATVVSAAKAGTMQSGGILSLQLTRVGNVAVITDVLDFNGQEGHKDVADSTPKKGKEAVVQAGALLQFHVMENGTATGLESGVTAADAAGRVSANPAGSGLGNQGMQAPAGTPNTAPAVNQRPIHGATQGVVPPSVPKL